MGSNPTPSKGVYLAQSGLERVAFNLVVVGSNPTVDKLVLWRNWIARLTSNQKVMGSNPIRITSHGSSVG